MSKHSDTDPKEVEVTSGSQAFGFFHRHQKVIIYTAGIFTLLTFSVTAALTDVTNKLFGPGFRGATVTLPGYGEVIVEED